ncbi:hypothetical protein BBJ28_00002404 [Nothophytophthora sp. Chile5]|nr:hypothetical protein BBJ28_00002404 [Nothophytophthora sp. Chile5]
MLRSVPIVKPSDVDDSAEDAVNIQVIREDQPLVAHETSVKDAKPIVAMKAAAAEARPTKVLFLDGVRGLAAIMVVTQHSHEYMQDLNLGAVAVDAFFVLSSFLLTWLFMKKSMKLLAQGASVRKWVFTLVDYFSKRFCRVYPLFALASVLLWFLSPEAKMRYFLVQQPENFDLYKVLTFEFDHRYFVFWTLPLEISYYFFIPVFVLAVLAMRRFWWVPLLPMYYCVINEGWYEYRTSHSLLRPHVPTFVAGSMAAIIFVKLDAWIKRSGFEFRKVHKIAIRSVECLTIAVFLSVTFRGLFFHWMHENTAPKTPGFPFISVLVTIVFVIEMILPSSLSALFEWSVLRYWGKISFSVYLLHSFVLYSPTVNAQHNYYDKMFSRFALILMLATASYHLVEYPSQLLSQRITKALVEQETQGSGGLAKFVGSWEYPTQILAQRIAWAQEGKALGGLMKFSMKSSTVDKGHTQTHDAIA